MLAQRLRLRLLYGVAALQATLHLRQALQHGLEDCARRGGGGAFSDEAELNLQPGQEGCRGEGGGGC